MEVDRLTDSLRKNSQATIDAQQRQASFAQAAAVRAQLPAIDQTEKLRNENELLVTTMINVQTTGGVASPILRDMGKTYEQLAEAVANSTSKVKNFKTEFEQAVQAQATQSKSLTAFSPSAKGDVAFEQRYNAEISRGTVETKAAALAAGDRALAIKGVTVALSEAARARELSSKQSIDSAQLEIDLLGKTIGQQTEMRANLQARQTLEQQASQNRTAFDDAEFERLKRNNVEAGRRTEMAARAAINDNVNFGRQTALLSPDDVQVAQQLKGLYPDVATALASVEAAGLRTNATLSGLSSTFSGTMTTGLTDILDGTKSVSAGLADMSKAVIRALEEALIKMTVVAPAMRALQMLMGGIGGGLGGGMGAGLSLTGTGGLYANGGHIEAGNWGIVGERGPELIRSSSSGTRVYSNPASSMMMRGGLPGFASGGFLPAPGGEEGDEAIIEFRKVAA